MQSLRQPARFLHHANPNPLPIPLGTRRGGHLAALTGVGNDGASNLQSILDAEDLPLLLTPGDADLQVPLMQFVEFKTACEKAGVAVQLVALPGAKQGGEFFVMTNVCDSWPNSLNRERSC